MKSFLIGLFGLTLFPAIGAVCCPLRWPSNPASRWRWTTPVRHRADRRQSGPFRKRALEDPPRDPHHPAVLAELHGLPLGIPADGLGDDGWETVVLALSCF